MTSASTNRRRALIAVAGASVAAITLAGCTAGGGGSTEAAGGTITIGTTEQITVLDPAGSYDNGTLAVHTQVFPLPAEHRLPAAPRCEPDLAESAEFTSPERVHGHAQPEA